MYMFENTENFKEDFTYRNLPSKHTTPHQRRYNVATTSWRCSDVTSLKQRHVFAGWIL